ncbi:DUF4172 domain-containing protein [Aeromonas salmonicida]|uniref:DUF4172 domain-containing protein n=1 Tax=Aeromonas salmonicida TaxID=645 RepID=UPI003F7CC510
MHRHSIHLIVTHKSEWLYRLGILIGSHSRSGNYDQTLNTLLANIIASSAIEGERLNAQSVRSSLA